MSNFQDNVSGVRPVQDVAPQQITATTSGGGVDVANTSRAAGMALSFVINTGAFSGGLDGSNLLTVSFEKDDNSGFSSPTAVPAADIFGAERISDNSTWDLILDDASDEDNSFKVGIRLNDPDNSFYRAVLTETGTVDGFIGVIALVGPDFQPES